ncbi:hypothetical protein ABLA76_08575 [Xenorhabdus sp. SGI240]
MVTGASSEWKEINIIISALEAELARIDENMKIVPKNLMGYFAPNQHK